MARMTKAQTMQRDDLERAEQAKREQEAREQAMAKARDFVRKSMRTITGYLTNEGFSRLTGQPEKQIFWGDSGHRGMMREDAKTDLHLRNLNPDQVWAISQILQHGDRGIGEHTRDAIETLLTNSQLTEREAEHISDIVDGNVDLDQVEQLKELDLPDGADLPMGLKELASIDNPTLRELFRDASRNHPEFRAMAYKLIDALAKLGIDR